MLQKTFALFIILLSNIYDMYLSSMAKSQFEFTEEARIALCPFVGTEGMQCFDNEPMKRSGRQLDASTWKLPRGVGITIDRSTGHLKAVAAQLTYSPETGRIWTDGFTGEMFDVFNEVMLGPPTRAVAVYNTSRIQIFRNASQFNAVWRQTFVDGRIRGGLLAQLPDLSEYMNEFSSHASTMVLSQSITGLYILTINPSTIHLNSFARDALSKLTPTFESDLYEDFVDKWGTHIITKSLIGGMVEERAKVIRCFHGDEQSLLVQCLPFEDRHSLPSVCKYYTDRNRVISKRRLGGNMQADNNQQWQKTLVFAPALLQVIDMVPLYDFIANETIKANLRGFIRYRQKLMNSNRNEIIRMADARLTSCARVIPSLSVDAQWQQHGSTVAGGNGEGGYNHQLRYPLVVLIDNDDNQTIVIVDSGNNRIIQWKIGDTNGQVVAGGNGPGNRLDQLLNPSDVLIDKETNSLIIADLWGRRVVRWSRRSGTIEGEILVDNISCFGLAMDEQRNLYVSDTGRTQVRRFEIDRGDKIGTVVAGGNGQGSGLNQFNEPRHLCLDRNQSLYVLDIQNNRVMKWDQNATQGIVVAGGQGRGAALTQLSLPHGIFVDEFGTIYVADTWNHRVVRWLQGAKQGTIVVGGNGLGLGSNQFNAVVHVSFDKFGNLYVVDWKNHRVQRFTRVK